MKIPIGQILNNFEVEFEYNSLFHFKEGQNGLKLKIVFE